MIKLNNKGFAISAVVYGLAIMGVLIVAILMRTVSSTRENQRELSEMIEKELNNLGMTANAYTPVAGGEAQVFTAQENALYKVELWGAAGNNGAGGKGSYTSGLINLKEGEKLYFFVGATTTDGGQETDVRVISNGGYAGHDSYETRIMVAGGGGKTGDARGLVRSDSLTLVPPTGSNGGGDGYIPGTSESEGGSSFISGHAGNQAIIRGVPELNNPTYNYYELKGYLNTDYDYGPLTAPSKKYYFIDGLIVPGVNAGGGKAVIKKINGTASSIKPSIKYGGSEMPSVKIEKITVCYSDSAKSFTTADKDQVKIYAIGDITAVTDSNDTGGENYVTNPNSLNSGCIVNTLTSGALDELGILGVDPNYKYNIAIKIPGVATPYNIIKSSPNKSGEIRYSLYQPLGKLPASKATNYYITTVASDNKFLTAESDKAIPQLLAGNKNQIWEITRIDDSSKYKIVEMSKYLALELDNNVIVPDASIIECINEYNTLIENQNQLFKFSQNNDGTFRITPYSDSGDIYSLILTDEGLKVTNRNDDDDRQKFKLINIDYNK